MRKENCHHSHKIHLIGQDRYAFWLFLQIHTFPFVELHDTRDEISRPFYQFRWQWRICRYFCIVHYQRFPLLSTNHLVSCTRLNKSVNLALNPFKIVLYSILLTHSNKTNQHQKNLHFQMKKWVPLLTVFDIVLNNKYTLHS